MYSQSWHRLNIDVTNAITPQGMQQIKDWKQSVPNNLPGGYWKLYHDEGLEQFFDQGFLKEMENNGVPIDMSVFFYRKPYYCHPTAHIDGSLTRNPVYALNWVLTDGPDDSDMTWYEMPKVEIPKTTTEYGTAQVDIDTTDLAELDRVCIGNQLTLVRVDIPHNIIVRSQARFVISVRCKHDMFENWDQAVEYFKLWTIE